MNGLQTLQNLAKIAAKARGKPSVPATVYQRKKNNLLQECATCDNPEMRLQVVRSLNCPAHILKDRILNDDDSRVVRACVLNPNTKREHIVQMIESAGNRSACASFPEDQEVIAVLRKRLA